MKRWNAMLFRNQILVCFLTVALLPLLSLVFFSTNYYKVSIRRDMLSNGEVQIGQARQLLEEFIRSAEETSAYLCGEDIAVQALINTADADYQKQLYQMLYEQRTSVSVDATVSIYDAGGNLHFTTKPDLAEAKLPLYWGVLAQARADKERFHVSASTLAPGADVAFRTSCSVDSTGGARIGYIVMDLRDGELDALFRGCVGSDDVLIITDAWENPIYSSKRGLNLDTAKKIMSMEPSGSSICLSSQLEQPEFQLYLQKSSPITGEMTGRMFHRGLLITMVTAAFCILLSVVLGRRLAEPISRLNRGMNQVKEGNLEVYVESPQKNELGELTDNFNHMTRELDQYMKNMVQRQKDIRDMQIKLFQTQLNPHFLYNTLDSMKWEARIHHLDDISSMSENLAYILQYSIRSGQFVPLLKELEILESYVQIQKIRFQGKFRYETEIPESLETCIVPKLMLQPIVENCIIHGLSEQENGLISVYADQVGDEIHIFVTDNGVGMSQEMIDWLNAEEFVQQEDHLGLANVNRIIKLYFGNEYGLHATVEEGIGTTITICLPIRREQPDD